ncbi:ATP-binding protein [Leyella stercorea]|uniref:ATP-binding protein n=1 Tax=Leyella stercorea TaxID=363265 RepID=UPI002431FF77|nr:ATP-binding protein [Leyella stercorea]
MERSIYSSLKKWKESPTRKPLILQGARQVGKTYILKEFGAREYSEVVYINCDDNNDMQNMFVDYDVDRIIRSLSAISGISIKPSTTLLILDEIQEVERGLASLKYFCEKAPEYHVAVAGSLLGITLHEGTSFPVGKVDMLYMYPMDFEEFLLVMGKEQLVELLRNNSWAALTPLRGMLTELLRQYYFVGGMPEAVKTYVERGDIWEVRSIHSKIIDAYRNDMSKHVPKQQVQRINMVWNSIPSQLARDNKKFIYGALRKGARANDFEIAIQWLVDSGLVHKVHRISKPVVPLKFYEDMASFKLFLLDCGLLGALSETPPEQILIGDNVFEEYKGAFTENYVLQQLKSLPRTFVYYYSNDNSTLEIDFVVQHDTHVIPIEVKAEENLRAKSLRQFVTDNSGLHGVRFSMSDYREQDWLTNVPLWAVRWAF